MVMTKEKPKTDIFSSTTFNRKYFVLHLTTSEIWIGQACSTGDACDKAGWWVEDCFAHYICAKGEYLERKA